MFRFKEHPKNMFILSQEKKPVALKNSTTVAVISTENAPPNKLLCYLTILSLNTTRYVEWRLLLIRK